MRFVFGGKIFVPDRGASTIGRGPFDDRRGVLVNGGAGSAGQFGDSLAAFRPNAEGRMIPTTPARDRAEAKLY